MTPHHALPPAVVKIDLRPEVRLYGPDGPPNPAGPLHATVKTTLMERHVAGAKVPPGAARTMLRAADGRPGLLYSDAAGVLTALRAEAGRHRGWVGAPVGGLPAGRRVRSVAAVGRERGGHWVAALTCGDDGPDRLRIAESFDLDAPAATTWLDWGPLPAGGGVEVIIDLLGGGPEPLVRSGSTLYHVLGRDRWRAIAPCGSDVGSLQTARVDHDGAMVRAAVWLDRTRGARWIALIDQPAESRSDLVSAWRDVPRGSSLGDHLSATGPKVTRTTAGRAISLERPSDGEVTALHAVWADGALEILAVADGRLWIFDPRVLRRWHCIAGDVVDVITADGTPGSAGLDLFVTDGEHLALLRRDPKTRHFHRAEVHLPHQTDGHRVLTGTTRIGLTDALGHPLPKVPLELRVDGGCYLAVNGHACFLEAGATLPVRTDGAGVIEIVKQLHGLSMPTLRSSNPALVQALALDPTAHIGSALHAVNRSGLNGVTLGEGARARPLVPPERHLPGDKAHEMVGRLAGHLREMADSRRAAHGAAAASMDDDARREGVMLVDPDAPKAAALRDHPFGHGCWRFRIDGGEARMTVYDEGEVPAIFAAAEGSDAAGLLQDIGAFVEHLVAGALGLVDVAIHAIGDGLRVVFNKVHAFAVKTLEALADVARAVLHNMLGIDLDRIVQWLGFFFAWDDIKRTHGGMRRTVEAGLRHVRDAMPRFEAAAHTQLKAVREAIDGMHLPPKVAAMTIDQVFGLFDPGQWSAATADAGVIAGAMRHHPGAHWAGTALAHGPTPAKDAMDISLGGGAQVQSDISAIFSKLGQHHAAALAHVDKHKETLSSAFGSRSVTLGALFDALRGLLEGGIVIVDAVAGAVIEAAHGMVTAVVDVLTRPIRMPVFGFVWKTVLGMPGELTLLDLLLLPLAVPATIIYKLATGRAPMPAEADALGDDGPFPFPRDLWGAYFGGLASSVWQSVIAGLDVLWADTNPVGAFVMVAMQLVSVAVWFPLFNPAPLPGTAGFVWAIWGVWALDAVLRGMGAIASAGWSLPVDMALGLAIAPVSICLEWLLFFATVGQVTGTHLAQAIMRITQASATVFGPALKAIIAALVAAENPLAFVFEAVFVVQRGTEQALYFSRVLMDVLRYHGTIDGALAPA